MDSLRDRLQTHPSTAEQAKSFVAPTSLAYPGGAGDLTPPSEKDGSNPNGMANGSTNKGGNANGDGTGVTPTTPAATPGATQGVSGIVPTLQ
jgi:transcription initiation factor TFIID TATA-box-binding protein